MSLETEQNRNELLAIEEVITSYTVGISLAQAKQIGTGTLIEHQGKKFVLTAYHIIEGADLAVMRFHLRPARALIEATPSEAMRRYGPHFLTDGVPLPLTGKIMFNRFDDVAILELSDKVMLGGGTAFYSVPTQDIPIPDGTTLIIVGYATDNSVDIAPDVRALIATATVAEFDSVLNARSDLHSSYDPARHFLLRYQRIEDSIKPHGLSGAGAWCNVNPTGAVWHANPRLVGVQTKWHPTPKLLQLTYVMRVPAPEADVAASEVSR